ncbi:hypothetical protein BSLG_008427 [Batrachochytrium salamandrivorans]|nr:hypothetical protein BSLG_008427 [Batrachochytrium salamandrivorans]
MPLRLRLPLLSRCCSSTPSRSCGDHFIHASATTARPRHAALLPASSSTTPLNPSSIYYSQYSQASQMSTVASGLSFSQPLVLMVTPSTSVLPFPHRNDWVSMRRPSPPTEGRVASSQELCHRPFSCMAAAHCPAVELDALESPGSLSRSQPLLPFPVTVAQSIQTTLVHPIVLSDPTPDLSLFKSDLISLRKPSIFAVFEKSASQLKKSYQFTLAATGKAKSSDAIIKNPIRGSSEYASIQVGDDAYFTRYDSMGVADGVGGWNEVPGANPALYSLKMMHYTHAEFDKYDDMSTVDDTITDYSSVSPKDILSRAYEQVNADAVRESIVGSTTALVAVLRENELRVANVGDCGIMILRAHKAIFRNEEQQHSFNFPYQLGTVSRDGPSDAQVFTIKVQEGDIVVIGSDGIFDNVFDEEIVEIVGGCTHESRPELSDPQRMTDAILYRAREVAENTRMGSSPFQTRAVQEGFYYQGGKMDDMTVIVGIVRASEDSPDRR